MAIGYKYLVKVKTKKVWGKGICNKIGQLLQGSEEQEGTNMIFFIFSEIRKISEALSLPSGLQL